MDVSFVAPVVSLGVILAIGDLGDGIYQSLESLIILNPYTSIITHFHELFLEIPDEEVPEKIGVVFGRHERKSRPELHLMCCHQANSIFEWNPDPQDFNLSSFCCE